MPSQDKSLASITANLRVRCQAGEDWACQQLHFQKPVGEPQKFAEGGPVTKDQNWDSMDGTFYGLSKDDFQKLDTLRNQDPETWSAISRMMQIMMERNMPKDKPEPIPTQPEGKDLGKQMLAEGGEVLGPGTGTSDSIDAKLSDGEFVFTANAVKQIGLDKLQKMMQKAEKDFNAGQGGTPTDQQMKSLMGQ